MEIYTMLINTKRQAHHINRYRQIASALSRHGLGWLSLQLGLGKFIPFHWGLLGHPKRAESYTQAEHMRMALEDLGTTFIKLGQILSTRPDLVPSEYIVQFSRLQDSVPPVPYPQVSEVITRELGAPPEKIFKTFDIQPLASASIGQVHAARLPDGMPVVVKVQRPGVEAVVAEDLAILADIARFAAQHTTWGTYYDIEELAEEFAYTLGNEMDYAQEGYNADRIRRNFNGDGRLRVPRIYWEYTTRRVLTMEEVSGIKITDIGALERGGLDRHRIAENCAHITLTMTYDHGFFHADPHPGNFFVLPDGVIGLIDYGMVGQLDENLQNALLRVDLALMRKDPDRLADELMSLGISRSSVKSHVLRRDCAKLIHMYYDKPLKEIVASQAFNEFVKIALRHRLQLPGDLILFFKVIAMNEGMGAQLDPEFKMMEFAGPYFKRFWLKKHSLGRQVKRIAEGTQELTELGLNLPMFARRMMGRLERGDMAFTSRIEGLSEILKEMKQSANRVSTSILAAALTVGLGLLMLIYHPPGWEAYGGWIFGLLFTVVVVFGLGMLWTIWRSGGTR